MIGRIALDLQKDSNYERRLKTAIQLAQTHKAELVGVYTTRLQQRYIFDDVSVPSQVRTMPPRSPVRAASSTTLVACG